MQWFDVSKAGLAQLLERKGKAWVVFELVQNALDEATTEVNVTLERIAGSKFANLTVTDNSPDGFHDLTHAFTLFAASKKKTDETKRGRFCVGDKLVLALCSEARIESTTGSVIFDANGRHRSSKKTGAGSIFTGKVKMTNEEIVECQVAVGQLLVPEGVRLTFNGEVVASRKPLRVVKATLRTEAADEEGVLRRRDRITNVEIYEPLEGECASLYELGIPVMETGDKYHINVCQKVPLSMDRDAVSPAYLAKIRSIVVNEMAAALSTEDANSPWVKDAVTSHGASMDIETVDRLASLRFGEKRVAFDPSDIEANSLAVSKGYTVIHGGHLSAAEWETYRRVGAIPAAGKVTPSPKLYSENGKEQAFLDKSKWTDGMVRVADYAESLAIELLDREISVRIVSDITWPPGATYGQSGILTFNVGKLGKRWFEGSMESVSDLILHEFGHEYSLDHMSHEYHGALTRLGAKLGVLALKKPDLFRKHFPAA